LKKYIVFKNDDVGKDFPNLKRWIDIVLKNDAKGAIGLIGKYLEEKDLVDYLNSLNQNKIEVFCHGYYHSYFPFFVNDLLGKRRIMKVEFDKSVKKHDNSLKKYRLLEKKYLKKKAICFGPPGNIWNENVIEPLLKHDFKVMFSWRKTKQDLSIIPLTENYKQDSLREFENMYDKNKDNLIYTLQFHHANLSDKQFKLLSDVIDFLQNNENRVFLTPSELLNLSKKDSKIFDVMSPEH